MAKNMPMRIPVATALLIGWLVGCSSLETGSPSAPPSEARAGDGPQVGRAVGEPTSGSPERFRGNLPGPSQLVVGLGTRGEGWVETMSTPPAPLHWSQVPWTAYNQADGSVRPATGDLDGDGEDEVVFGLGRRGQGWIYVAGDATGTDPAPGWHQISHWTAYSGSADAPIHPACVDLTGDGKAEIVLGTGSAGAGWVQILQYFNGQFTPLPGAPGGNGYLQVGWGAYTAGGNAPTYPAGGNLDGVGGEELVLGLGPRGAGWAQIWTWNGSTLVPYAGTPHAGGWVLLDWGAYNAGPDASIFPACGDLDRDGKDDLVLGLSGRGAGWFSILRSTGASLTPMPGMPWGQVPWGAYSNSADAPTHPTCGDVDGDDADDLVVGLGDNGLGWVYMLSGGTLAPPAFGPWAQVSWAGYRNASPSPTYPAIACALGPGPPWTDYKSGLSVRNGAEANWLQTGDFNEDGHLDILVAPVASSVQYLQLYFGTGTGALTAGPTLNTFSGQSTVRVSDVNGDGHLDLTDASGSWLGTGTGEFEIGPPSGAEDYFQLVEVNGDGRPDLVSLHTRADAIDILLAQPDGSFSYETRAWGTGSPLGGSDPPFDSELVAAADFDGDVDLDLVVAGNPIQFFRNQGGGSFDDGVEVLASPTGDGNSLVAGDFNADGEPDVVMTRDGELAYLYGQGDGTFAAGGSYPTTGLVGSLRALDYDRDGKSDIAGTGTLWRGTQATGDPFEPSGSYPVPSYTFNVAVGDFNGDGWPDLASGGHLSGTVTVHLNRLGEFAQNLDPLGIQAAVAAGDFNADGALDVVSIRDRSNPPAGPSTRTLWGNGAGQFVRPFATDAILHPGVVADFDLPPHAGGSQAEVADLDLDGDDDVVLHDPTYHTGWVQVILAEDASATGWSVQPAFSIQGRGIQLARFNEDPNLDLIYVNTATGALTYQPGLGNGAFGAPVQVAAITGSAGPILLSDFNNDRLPDVGLQGPGTEFYAYLAQPVGGYQRVSSTTPSATVAAFGDVNSDNRPDVIFVGPEQTLFVCLQQGGRLGPATPLAPSSEPRDPATLRRHSVRVADVSRDGVADVVVADPYVGVRIYVSEGDGEFEPERIYGADAVALTIAELDGSADGPEIVVGGEQGLFFLER